MWKSLLYYRVKAINKQIKKVEKGGYIGSQNFLHGSTALVGQGLLIFEKAPLSHSDTPRSVGLFWTSDRTVAETYTWVHTTLSRERHPCPQRDFKLSILVSERPQTHLLDRLATEIRRIAEFNEKTTSTLWRRGGSSSNVGKPAHPVVVVYPRKFHWILSSRKLQNIQNSRSTGKESKNLKKYTLGTRFKYYDIIPTTKINTMHRRRDTLYNDVMSYFVCWISGFKFGPGDRPVLPKYISCYSIWSPNTFF